jgi:hypothetical protein
MIRKVDLRCRIYLSDLLDQPIHNPRPSNIGLVNYDAISERDLFACNVVTELFAGVQRVNDSDNGLQLNVLPDIGISEKRLQHRRRVSKPGCFDDQSLKPIAKSGEQITNARYQIRPDGATHASVVDFNDGFFVGDDELTIDAHLAELIDYDSNLHRPRRLEDVIDKRCLSGT